MDQPIESPQPSAKVPWAGRWGLFGISWFAALGLAVPLVVAVMMFGEMHRADPTMDQSPGYRGAFIAVGAAFLLIGGLVFGLIGGLLTYLATMRRWYVPPTIMFLLVVLGVSGLAYIGMMSAIEDTRAESDARAGLARANEEAQQAARRQIEEHGMATPTPGEGQAALDSLREVSRTASDPDEAEVFAIAADIGERLNGLMEQYYAAMGPYLEISITDVANDVSEYELLERIEILERAAEKNSALIEYLKRLPVHFKSELVNRTAMNAATRERQTTVFLDEFNHDDVMVVRNGEGEFLEASRDQLMILLDTHGLWESTPEGIDFAAEIDDSYIERFNAAYAVIQRVAADQMAAQRRIYGAPDQP